MAFMEDHNYCRYINCTEEVVSYENIIVSEIKNIKALLAKREELINNIQKTERTTWNASYSWEDIFPAKTVTELNAIDDRINYDRKFRKSLVWLLRRLMGPEQSLDDVFKYLAIDEVYIKYNYYGKCSKHSLKSLKLFSEILFIATSGMNLQDFVKETNKTLKRAHNRLHKKLGRERERTTFLE